ncbi:MAG: YabP/YqfC family sporulation protein [Porcipelethomonas sp.]
MPGGIVYKGRHFLNMETQIQITGSSEVLVECCKKILEFNDIMVKVRTWDLTVVIWGSDLKVNDYNASGIYVCGKIQSVELTEIG